MSVAGGTLSPMKHDDLRETLRLAGVVTTAALMADGKSERQIRTLVRRGNLISVRRGVYARQAVAGRDHLEPAGGALLRVAAALAVVGLDAVVSHQSAAQLYGIDLLGNPGPNVTLNVPPEYGWRALAGIILHTAKVPPDQLTTHQGMPMTTPARTVIDLARILDFPAALVAADSALHRKLATKAELQSVVASCRRWPGIKRAAEVVEFADRRAESPLESIARVVFRDFGLPPPDLQVWLGWGEEPTGRVDFYWRKYKTIAEVDGAFKYQDGARARNQLRRDALFRADGFEIVHFDWHEITQTPQKVAAAIREAFRRGSRPAASG
jgi:Transcriptional regulator, AbiEi antitoxin/Protein of unknown function (DUF559)